MEVQFLLGAQIMIIQTAHGKIRTPFFMPVATRGQIKSLSNQEIKLLKAQIILLNAYHLMVYPGLNYLKKIKDIRNLIGWSGPILTDSGGYQVFSLTKFRKITPEGVYFREPKSGQEYFLSPEKSIEIQIKIGADIIMVLDECPPYPCDYQYAVKSLEITLEWAKRCKKYFEKHKKRGQLLFGIVQGSIFRDLREKSVQQLIKIGFDGYAIGGVSVGESKREKNKVLRWVLPLLPNNQPRYLMGVGWPEEIVKYAKMGIDMFDCVIPTRHARHGQIFDFYPNKDIFSPNFYQRIDLKKKKYRNHPKYQYLHYLFRINDPLGPRLATIHNLKFYLELMKKLRKNRVRHNNL